MKKLSLLLLLILFMAGCNMIEDSEGLPTKIETNTTDDGLIWTSKTWYWSPKVNREQIFNYVDVGENAKREIPLLVGYKGFITIEVPNNIPYIYEYGLSVKAEDCSYTVDIRRDTTIESLIENYGLSGYKYLADNVVESQDSGVKVIIAVVDNYYGIIATIYDNDYTYSIIRDSLLSLEVNAISSIYMPDENVIYLDELPTSNVYTASKEIDGINIFRDMHLFADGSLIIQSEVQHFDEIYDKYATVLEVFAGEKISHIYRGNSYTFMKAGAYSLCLFAYNSNTTVILMGDCPEAETNIVSIIESLK